MSPPFLVPPPSFLTDPVTSETLGVAGTRIFKGELQTKGGERTLPALLEPLQELERSCAFVLEQKRVSQGNQNAVVGRKENRSGPLCRRLRSSGLGLSESHYSSGRSSGRCQHNPRLAFSLSPPLLFLLFPFSAVPTASENSGSTPQLARGSAGGGLVPSPCLFPLKLEVQGVP